MLLEELVICPICKSRLEIFETHMMCTSGHKTMIKEGVISMVESESYSASFGEQWNHFSETQIDSINGYLLTENRFFDETGWQPKSLTDAIILDAGCGSGRFTEIASKFAKRIVAVDLSNAVFAIPDDITKRGNILRIHGDIGNLSLDFSKITHVFSIGVLQHTPDPYETLRKLVEPLSSGTKYAFTAYGKKWHTQLHPKYLLRPVTKRVPRGAMLTTLEYILPKLFGFLMFLVRPPATRKLFKFLLPVALYPEYEGDLDRETLVRFTILDTFDALTPKHDSPLTVKKTRRILEPLSSKLEFHSSVPLIVRGERA